MKNYKELREEIKSILVDYFNEEYEPFSFGEFDYEYEESIVDRILWLIREQGGTY